MNRFYLCLDVGGTEIKAAPVDTDGKLLGSISRFPAWSGLHLEPLLDHFARIFRELQAAYPGAAGLRLAFPGPFDYEAGISQMQGLDKYDALYGVPLIPFFSRCTGLPQEEILFCNDVGAFALGEMGFGEAAGARRSLFLCIGTGCGSAFGVQGRLVGSEIPGVPDLGYVYNAPFLDGCIDDYISKRGLEAFSRSVLGTALDGKALAQRASSGDTGAAACFRTFGGWLRDAILPFLDSFRPDCLCLGGQITKSASLFQEPLELACQSRGIRLYVTAETSRSALQGLTLLPLGVKVSPAL